MKNRSTSSDKIGASELIAGVCAAVGFLIMALGLKFIPLWLAVPLAVGLYFGVRLALPLPKPEVVPVESAESMLIDLEKLNSRMPEGSSRIRLRNITELAGKLLRYYEANPEKASESLFVIRKYLESLRGGLKRYMEVVSFSLQTEATNATLAELLETVFQSLKNLQSELVEKENSDLSGNLKALNKTLQEVDMLWLRVGDSSGDRTGER